MFSLLLLVGIFNPKYIGCDALRKTKLEGSMVEGYAFEEALGFCTKYLQYFTTTTQNVG